MLETITNGFNAVVADATLMQLNFFGGLIIAVGVIGVAAVLTAINSRNKEQNMLNISPDAYVYISKIVIGFLFASFLYIIFWGTRTGHFKTYDDTKRDNEKKKG